MADLALGVSLEWMPGVTLDEMEKMTIIAALIFHDNHRINTAKALGISIRTMNNRLRKYRNQGVAIPPPRTGAKRA